MAITTAARPSLLRVLGAGQSLPRFWMTFGVPGGGSSCSVFAFSFPLLLLPQNVWDDRGLSDGWGVRCTAPSGCPGSMDLDRQCRIRDGPTCHTDTNIETHTTMVPVFLEIRWNPTALSLLLRSSATPSFTTVDHA